GFRAPDCVVDAVRGHLDQAQGYSDSKGIMEAREAIAAYCRDVKNIAGVTANDVYTGNGASELISLSMQALLDRDDEILIPTPDYPLWTATATLAGGTVVHYRCDEKAGWLPDIADIRKKITPYTRAIVVINPNNPTGALYTVEVLEEIVALAREHGLIIFADEIYDRLVMDGLKHTSIASLAPDVPTVTFNGLSKSHLAAGYRAGWMCISGNKVAAANYIEGLNMLSSMRLCSNVQAQYSIAPALADPFAAHAMLEPGGRVYEQRECMMKSLAAIDGISVVRPSAAFYSFPHLDAKRFGIVDDERFALDFLREKHVLLVHGGGFHWPEPDHFRIVYLPTVDVLSEAIGKLGEFLDGYHQKP
ncbi:MAG: pyridoxal phosphate-dependent aminotransferase, partial [Eubacteriales bacterium]|nr:pyridoxal phosphate-dependent aminotransferase [Eubacteriales bacterium]